MDKKKQKEAWAENGLEDWGAYMAAKKAKLEDQFQELADSEFQNATKIFNGIAIFVNGYTTPCADELKRLMMAHGGIYHHYQRSNVTTHLIASNLPYTKIVQYRKSKNPLPLCKPEWITDSIKAQKLLDWRPYLLYNSTSVTQPQLQFGNKSIGQDSAVAGPSRIDDSKITSNSTTSSTTVSKATKTSGTALCSKNEEFLTEFYNNSRLHHISTMGATFKEYVNELRSKNHGSFPGLERLKQSIPKTISPFYDSDEDLFASSPSNKSSQNEIVIMHIDMDCFFVSVGLRSRPELRGLPVAVTHARGNGNLSDELGSMAEIASCSYEARKAGLKNGMFLGQALKLCPNLKTIKYDFDGYKEVSYNLYNIVASYTLEVEAVSCDEMYADISDILTQCNMSPLEFASHIRDEIKQKTGCPVSTGFGSNKLQARLATKRAKPDGQFYLKKNDVKSYIGGINVRDIPGVGYSTMHQLKKMNVSICLDLQKISMDILQKEFGKKTGEMLYNTCRGIDQSKLNIEHVRKSVSTEVNYGIRFENEGDARDFIRKLTTEVCSRLIKTNSRGRCITLKLMVRAKDAPVEPAKFMGHGHCDNYTKSKNLLTPVDDEIIIAREVLSLWDQLQQPAYDIRGIGIQISRLEPLKKQADTFMMKFVTKTRPVTTEKDGETPTISANNPEPNLPALSVVNNCTTTVKKTEIKSTKPQGLKAFFTAKKSAVPPVKPASNNSLIPSQIDEAVLAELPEDIRREILEFQTEDAKSRRKPEELSDLLDKNEDNALEDTLKEDFSGKSLPSSQGIDESVLIELPADIRNEILASKPIIKKSNGRKEPVQPAAEDFFKHTKPGKISKAKLPDIKQLDMQVLIELPDDIRNEILNHYKSNPAGEVVETSTELNHEQPPKINNHEKKNNLDVSFSQVDPEFFAALSEDIQEDVKRYCTVIKKNRETEVKKPAIKNAEIFNTKPKPQVPIKLNKRGRKPKNMIQTNKKKIVGKKNIISSEKTKENDNRRNFLYGNDDGDDYLFRDRSFLANEIDDGALNDPKTIDKREIIKAHLFGLGVSISQSDEPREILINLVNCLLTLPMRQVKSQIQAWISNNHVINEIDTLAMMTYLGMLPGEKKIEDLHVLMKTMHRCMTETGSCVWHETYKKTVDNVQQYMQIEYNSNLMLPPIGCDLCKRKSMVMYD